MKWYIFLGSLCMFIDTGHCQTSKVYQLIYKDVNVNDFDKCVRLLNGTTEVGCQSTTDGNVGVLHHINTTQSINNFLNNPTKRNYVLLVEASFFNKFLVTNATSNGNVQGIIVYEEDSYEAIKWSPDLSCPNEKTSLYNETYSSGYKGCNNRWNTYGDGLTEENIPFPVFYITSNTVRDNLISCYEEHNNPEKFPLCAVQMKARMFGAVDSVTCTRRSRVQTTLTPVGFCDPIGGNNIVASLKQLSASNISENNSAIFVTSTLDSRSFMMTSTAPGVDKATGFITLLGVAQALGRLSQSQKQELQKNIVFVLFDGESFDNIGSTRMVADMKKRSFPVERTTDNSKVQPPPWTLNSIYKVIELGQLGLANKTVWAHYDPVFYNNTDKTEINDMIAKLIMNLNTTTALNFSHQSAGLELAPSSLHSILKERPQKPGIVLTDYDQQFTNTHYFSRYDDLKNLIGAYNKSASDEEIRNLLQPLAVKLSTISTAVAKALYQLASTDDTIAPPGVIAVDEKEMTDLLFCFLHKPDCDLFRASRYAQATNELPKDPYLRYPSAFKDSLSEVANITLFLLASFTGEKMANFTQCNRNDTNQVFTYYHIRGPGTGNESCVISSSFKTPAISLGFEKEDWSTARNEPGLWTESRWARNAFRLRMFLIQDETSQGLVLLAGLLVLVSSFVVLYFVDAKGSTLFRTEISI